MLSKNKIKFIQSLSRKKIREQENVFLVEGNKMVIEALQSNFSLKLICGTLGFLKENNITPKDAEEVYEALPDEIEKASLLRSPQESLAIVKIPERQFQASLISSEFTLALDFIQDPGNLGTIIRIADWFGIKHILCSENTVDCYNPKVIQASMGAIFRVQLHYLNLTETLTEANKIGIPIFGTFLEGENIYKHSLNKNGILVMGNEGNGISGKIESLITNKIHIPSFPANEQSSESLNVATATAICCSEFRRRIF